MVCYCKVLLLRHWKTVFFRKAFATFFSRLKEKPDDIAALPTQVFYFKWAGLATQMQHISDCYLMLMKC